MSGGFIVPLNKKKYSVIFEKFILHSCKKHTYYIQHAKLQQEGFKLVSSKSGGGGGGDISE